MPTQERLGTNDPENLQNRREPMIKLDKEQAINVRQPDPTAHLTPHYDQLTSGTAFSASSRLFDLNGAAKTARTKHSNAIMMRRR